MSVTIHPHRGYLNTNFHVNVCGSESQTYEVYPKDKTEGEPIAQGSVQPNIPHVLSIPKHGDYTVIFDSMEQIEIHVEDGYKFGGSEFKKAFIFDDCPWCFVVMHDRTYFYNRDTKREYVESISPDKISAISSEYVLLENKGHAERTIYSGNSEKPILCISNIITHTEKIIVWKETEENKKVLCVWSFGLSQDCVDRFEIDDYSFDESRHTIIFYHSNKIYKLSTSNYNGSICCSSPNAGSIVSVVSPNVAITYHIGRNTFYL